MNSVLLKENVKEFINKMDTDSVLALADLSVKYQDLMKECDPERLKLHYEKILDYVKQKENNIGIQILSSPDQSYIFAVNALSGLFQRIHEKNKENMRPERKKINFRNIGEADMWLHNNPNVSVEEMNIRTGTSWGYFANHPYIQSVSLYCVDHKKPTGYIYGICEEEHSRHFFSASVKEYIVKWIEDNPEKEYVDSSSVRSQRGDSGSLKRGIGVSENTLLVILYRRKVD